ncbi:MAG: hypothetical protein WD069_09045 [Planctomycetales bacterium]
MPQDRMPQVGRRLRTGRFAAAVLLLCAAGCSTFSQDFRAAQQYCPPERGLDGVWEGTWESETNGHNGRLRAIITRCDDRHYHARFHATFLKCVPFESEAMLHVTEEGAATFFHGQEDLGWLAGGVYTYDGRADRCEFFANYCAEKDRGVFAMRRVSACGGCGEDACDGCCE